MLADFLRRTRTLRRLAIAGVAVAAVLLVANVPRVPHGHDSRVEEAISEATEHFGSTPWSAADGPDPVGPALPFSPVVLLAPTTTRSPQPATTVVVTPRAAYADATASRAPPARA